jgi:hypothetical protein
VPSAWFCHKEEPGQQRKHCISRRVIEGELENSKEVMGTLKAWRRATPISTLAPCWWWLREGKWDSPSDFNHSSRPAVLSIGDFHSPHRFYKSILGNWLV